MVYCGKPSKGCELCRKRKIRCDQKRPECSQCIRSKQQCSGYRDPMALMFRNESEAVVRKAHQKKDSKKDQERTTAQTQIGAMHLSFVSERSPASSTELVTYSSPGLGSPPHLFQSLSPPVQDMATCFFFHNFVMSDSGDCKGHMDHLPQMMQTSSGPLSAAISSVGMACLSNVTRSPGAMVAARQEYASAVRLTNYALQDPLQSKADGILMTVMLLGMFETITCMEPQSMKAWTNHVDGAAALLRVRGSEQFQHRIGLNMFFELRSQILISAIQREVYIPDTIFEWSSHVHEKETPDEACASRLTDIIVRFADLRAKMGDDSVTESLEIVETLLIMDADLAAWAISVPVTYGYITKASPSNPNTYENYYHIYPSFWTASSWNNYRSVRILLNECLLIHLNRIATSPSGPTEDFSAQREQVHLLLKQLCSELCASAPYFLGMVSIPSGQPASTRRSLGGFQIMWPLFVCGSNTFTERPLRNWIVGQLESIGYTMGVQQAIPLAELIKRNGNLLEWSRRGDETNWDHNIQAEHDALLGYKKEGLPVGRDLGLLRNSSPTWLCGG